MDLIMLTNMIWKATQSQVACSVMLKNDSSERVVDPYGVCKTEQNKVALVCFQVSGYSEKGNLPQFRNLILENIKSFELRDEPFVVHPIFNPDDRQYVEWVFHI